MALNLVNLSLMGDFSYISKLDTAVDTECEGFDDAWDKYLDGAEQLPPLVDNIKPTIFTLRPIKSATLSARLKGVLSASGAQAWAVETAAHGIKGIDGQEDQDGRPLKLEMAIVDGFECLSESAKDLLGEQLLAEIGARLIAHNSPS